MISIFKEMCKPMVKNNRINIIDEVRGALIILVVVYHILYDSAVIFKVKELWAAYRTAHILQPFLPFMFILISGIAFKLSRDNIKRGLFLGVVALAVTAATWLIVPQYIVIFGILHFLALMHILCGIVQRFVKEIPAKAWIVICALCAVLFVLTYNIQLGYIGIEGLFTAPLPDALYQSNALMVFGFHTIDFVSADYNPILPWIFLFVIGIFIGKYIQKLPESLKKPHIRPLAFIGRHTLIIYIAHQPIIYGVLWLIC